MQQIFVDEGSIFRSTFRGLLEDEIFLCLRFFCVVPRNMFYKGNFRRVVRDVLRASPAGDLKSSRQTLIFKRPTNYRGSIRTHHFSRPSYFMARKND
jgi:hypothetical protein